jgi:hypothetical protein
MRPRAGGAWSACVAAAAALATAAGGCTVGLVSAVSRSGGYKGAGFVPRASSGSRDDVPVHGHRVNIGRRGGTVISGELIAASEDEVVVDSAVHRWVRIPAADVKYVEVELAPGQAGPTALMSLGAMVIGIFGIAGLHESSWISVFLAGWGVVWVPLGLLVALPTAGVIAASGDSTLDSRYWGLAAVRRNLYEFARFPQGEPGRTPKRAPATGSATTPPVTPGAPPPGAPPSPPATVPGSAAPRPSIETIPSVAPPPVAPPSSTPPKPKPAPAPPPPAAEPEDPDEPTVVPYSPDRTPPPAR